LLKPATLKHLHRAPFAGHYMAGWQVRKSPFGRTLTHMGSNNRNFALAWVLPDREFATGVMVNQGGPPAQRPCTNAIDPLIRRFLR